MSLLEGGEEGGNLRVCLIRFLVMLPHCMKHLRQCIWKDPRGDQSWT